MAGYDSVSYTEPWAFQSGAWGKEVVDQSVVGHCDFSSAETGCGLRPGRIGKQTNNDRDSKHKRVEKPRSWRWNLEMTTGTGTCGRVGSGV